MQKLQDVVTKIIHASRVGELTAPQIEDLKKRYHTSATKINAYALAARKTWVPPAEKPKPHQAPRANNTGVRPHTPSPFKILKITRFWKDIFNTEPTAAEIDAASKDAVSNPEAWLEKYPKPFVSLLLTL